MKCKICNNDTKVIFNRKVLGKYSVNYNQCIFCGFIQTDEPFWLEEAYKNPINIDDTGLVSRNIFFAKRSSSVLFFLFDHQGKFLDFAGGYGLFTRIMRDYGFNFYWSDPFTQNLFARGFELDISSPNIIEALTTFECFEHFADPIIEIEKMLNISGNILFSTEIFKSSSPEPDAWKYYSFSHGQHISFYSYKSLEWIAKRYDKKLCSNGKSFHMLTDKKISNTLFNSLLILANTGLPLFIRLMMKSKTHSDSEQLKNNNN